MNINNFIFESKINSCGISPCNPNWHWDTGVDGFADYDLWTVIQGEGVITTKNEKYPVSAGTSLLLKPHTHYIGVQNPNNHIMTVNVHFSTKYNIDEILKNQGGAIPVEITDIMYLRDTLFRVIRLFNRNEQELADNIFHSALIEYFSYGLLPMHSNVSTSHLSMIEKLCDDILSNPQKDYNLDDLSKQIGYSRDYIGRMFTKHTGLSLSEYIKNARINKAKLLLDTTNLNVNEIASELGFYDTCYFLKQFKSICGCTPGKYRKRT